MSYLLHAYVPGNIFMWFIWNASFIPHNYLQSGKFVFRDMFCTVDKKTDSRLEMDNVRSSCNND